MYADFGQETERLMSDSPPGISAAPKDDNLRHFDVSVSGPGQSPYEGKLSYCIPPVTRADHFRWYIQIGTLFA